MDEKSGDPHERVKKNKPELQEFEEDVLLDTANAQQHYGDMERLAALEIRFDAILPTLATKADIESLRSEIHKSSGETHKWMLGTVIGVFLGFGGLFLAMSNALKPSASTPNVFYAAPQAAIPILQIPSEK